MEIIVKYIYQQWQNADQIVYLNRPCILVMWYYIVFMLCIQHTPLLSLWQKWFSVKLKHATNQRINRHVQIHNIFIYLIDFSKSRHTHMDFFPFLSCSKVPLLHDSLEVTLIIPSKTEPRSFMWFDLFSHENGSRALANTQEHWRPGLNLGWVIFIFI